MDNLIQFSFGRCLPRLVTELKNLTNQNYRGNCNLQVLPKLNQKEEITQPQILFADVGNPVGLTSRFNHVIHNLVYSKYNLLQMYRCSSMPFRACSFHSKYVNYFVFIYHFFISKFINKHIIARMMVKTFAQFTLSTDTEHSTDYINRIIVTTYCPYFKLPVS